MDGPKHKRSVLTMHMLRYGGTNRVAEPSLDHQVALHGCVSGPNLDDSPPESDANALHHTLNAQSEDDLLETAQRYSLAAGVKSNRRSCSLKDESRPDRQGRVTLARQKGYPSPGGG
jgi:hypothetical protein